MDAAMTRSSLPYGLKRSQCAVCKARHDVKKCGGCKVVYYCGREHQSADRTNHKTLCNLIKQTREALAREEASLRTDTIRDRFRTAAGCFWDHADTHAYMRARLAAAGALLGADTKQAGETALRHLQSLLRLDRRDELGVRDVIPALMLRLGLEQECYDFIKWWATVDAAYDFRNVSLPFLNIRSANVLEPMEEILSLDRLSVSQLATLTLLRVRLKLDLEMVESEHLDQHPYLLPVRADAGLDSDSDREWDPLARQLGPLAARTLLRTGLHPSDLNRTVQAQCRRLWQVVHDRNPYFWEMLADKEALSMPPYLQQSLPYPQRRGTVEEAELAVSLVKAAWDESDDADVTRDAETAGLTRVYRPLPLSTAENRRGTGRHFPTQFEPSATSNPADFFPATPVGDGGTRRFVSRDGEKLLVLVYADGACPDNGQDRARGGWAVVFGPAGRSHEPNVASGPLEDHTHTPFGDVVVPATSNRAELRAAIAALRVRDWRAEGFDSVVVATDSSYVVDGVTAWARAWTRNEWKTTDGEDVKNRDLWELLLGECEKCRDGGLGVQFWKIPRDVNSDADAAAKKVAKVAASDVSGLLRSPGPGPASARPRVLAVCLEASDTFDRVWKTYTCKLLSKASLVRATTAEAALSVLNELDAPSIILVTDGALTRRRRVWERVMDVLVGAGATVVVAGCFSSLVSVGEFGRFFAKLGLPWRMGEYSRHMAKLQPAAVGDHRPGLAARLPAAYSQKAVFVEGADRASVWYAADHNPNMAAAVFTKVGNGCIGYVGDVNGEVASATVALAMCGLLE